MNNHPHHSQEHLLISVTCESRGETWNIHIKSNDLINTVVDEADSMV